MNQYIVQIFICQLQNSKLCEDLNYDSPLIFLQVFCSNIDFGFDGKKKVCFAIFLFLLWSCTKSCCFCFFYFGGGYIYLTNPGRRYIFWFFQSGREAEGLTRRQHTHLHHDHSLSSALTNSLHPFSTNDNNSISSINQPNYNSGRLSTWQGKSGSLSNLNEKTVPSYQVSRSLTATTYKFVKVYGILQ